jgi:hypothetical protein
MKASCRENRLAVFLRHAAFAATERQGKATNFMLERVR